MSITDELREYAGVMEHMTVNNFDPVHGASFILSLADRIDAEHEKQVTDAFTKDAIDGIDMAEHSIEYVKLPVDADGVPIHVGDRLRFNNGMIAEVRYLKIDSGGTSVCVLATNGGGDFYAITDKAHHHHAPTVEDVLREFAEKITDSQIPGVHPTYEEAIAEYTQRLTLAGGAE